MSGMRGSKRHFATTPAAAPDTGPFDYFPPCRLLLQHLGISATDLEGAGTVPVSRKFLRVLINELARQQRVDEAWYAETYPDVEGARLAGDIRSLREHFATSGYIEGRLPADIPFDAEWYRSHYRDIAETLPAADHATLRSHFLDSGYFEGRAGTAEMLKEVEHWHELTDA